MLFEMIQAQLRKDLEDLHCMPDFRGKFFHLSKKLQILLSRERVANMLREISSIPGYHVDEITKTIIKGSLRVFVKLFILVGMHVR
jgi:hypothetical protein